MVKFPVGRPHPHILQSHGADKNINKFYITENSTHYTRGYEKFQPRPGRHTGTGYASNFRPQIFYTRHLDEIDNPTMARICDDNYDSVTTKHFRPYDTPTGKEELPMFAHQRTTGFTKQPPLTIPNQREVKSVNANLKLNSLPNDYQPNKKCYLQKIQSKDPVEDENHYYGPNYMSTESSKHFVKKPLNGPQVEMSTATLGPNEISGFVHNKNVEPVTFHPDLCHKGNLPGWMTDRPTGISIFKTDFNRYGRPYGDEKNPQVTFTSDRNTGFVREKVQPEYVRKVHSDAYDRADQMPAARLFHLKKVDPAEYMNATHPNNGSSTAQIFYRGKQRPDMTYSDRINHTGVGNQELSGFSENNDTWHYKKDNVARFTTDNHVRFTDPTPKGKAREGFVQGGVETMKQDGFTKSTSVHQFGPDVDSTATLRRLAPYVSRSIKARDQFFDDHTYDNKTNVMQRSMTVM
ncbi:PPP1R32 [Bugula neritina]|uniref:PPP1R32 n=1 Tax=Bugula neritina TaxID=10212 RepID=A0A7J7IR83_BUGNE|nr:PPP1R32 [Bugula neritina]